MNYIKSIRAIADGSEGAYVMYFMSPTGFEFELSDQGFVGINAISIGKVLGIASSWLESCMIVVKHDAKEAMLYKFIKSAETDNTNHAIPGNWDACILQHGMVDHFRGVVCGEATTLAIDTGENAIEVCGPSGSVCIRSGSRKNMPEVFNLYGLLGTLCKETGLNLFKYKRLVLHSDSRPYTTEIEFVDTPEATRFFSKMSLDIAGREEVGFKRCEGVLLL